VTLLLDQLVRLLITEQPAQRRKWIAAHARAVRSHRRKRPPPTPTRWTYAVVVGGKIVSVR
jgi:hypothetical protein